MYTTFDVLPWVQICSFHFKVFFVTSLRGKAHVHIFLVASLDKRREKLKQLPSRERSHILFPRHFWVDDVPFPHMGYVSVPWRVYTPVHLPPTSLGGKHQIPRIHFSKGNHDDVRGGKIMFWGAKRNEKKKVTQSSITFAPWHLALEHLGKNSQPNKQNWSENTYSVKRESANMVRFYWYFFIVGPQLSNEKKSYTPRGRYPGRVMHQGLLRTWDPQYGKLVSRLPNRGVPCLGGPK